MKKKKVAAPTYRPYEEALAWAKTLGLKNHIEWKKFVKSGALPKDIPERPNMFYKEWLNFDVWLDTVSQNTKKILDTVKQQKKIVYVYSGNSAAQNIVSFGWAEGTINDLTSMFVDLRRRGVLVLRTFEFEPNIEEFIERLIGPRTATQDLNRTGIYDRPFVIHNIMDLFFELDMSLMPIKFDGADSPNQPVT